MSNTCRNQISFIFQALALFSMFFAWQAHAGDSSYTGGNSGTSHAAITCTNSSYRVSGLDIRIERNSGLIKGISARCTKKGVGGIAVNDQVITTSYSVGAQSSSGMNSASINCPTGQWISGIQGQTRKYAVHSVLSRISIDCYKADAAGLRTGNANRESAGSGGAPAKNRSCPNKEIAYGLKYKSGTYLDAVALKCKSGGQKPAVPQLRYPVAGNIQSDKVPVGRTSFRISLQAGVDNFSICLKQADSNCWHQASYSTRKMKKSGSDAIMSLSIPTARAGDSSAWTARACAQALCSNWASQAPFVIVPSAARHELPALNSQSSSRSITFTWQNRAGADHYRLIAYNAAQIREKQAYDPNQPTSATGNNVINSKVTNNNIVLNLPTTLGNNVGWGVVACVNYGQNGERCSLGFRGRKFTISTGTQSSAFGWQTAISEANKNTYTLPAASVGKDLQDVLTGNVSVRIDNGTCKGCHLNGQQNATFTGSTSRTQACDELQDFSGANKPSGLKEMFANWLSRNCPN